MKKARNVAALVMALVMGLSTGCAGASSASKSEGTSSTTAATTSGTAKTVTGGTVKVALGSEPDSLDPMMSAATDTSAVMMNVFEGLLGFNQKGEFIPAIAEKYTISEDKLTYTFTIKKGIKFHDGKDCTAKDVKYTYEKLAGLTGEKALSSTIAGVVAKVDAPDDYTIVISLKQVDAGFLTKAIVSIVEQDYADNATKPIGTGPFKFVEYSQGQKIVLEKNADYTTNPDRKASLDKVEFVIMTDENAKLMALKSGTLDVAGVTPANAAALGDTFDIVKGPQNMVQVFALNNKVEALSDVKVRQAICYAIDKDEIINAVVDGDGTKVDSFLSPSMPTYYNSNLKAYNFDLEKAKTLMKEAGKEKGFNLSVTVPSNYQTHVDTAQVLKEQLAKINITLEIKLVEWAQWLDGVYGKREYETTVIGHSGKLDPQDFLNRFSSTYAKNYFNFSDPAYDELITKAAATTDTAERATFYKDCQQMLVDKAASVFIQDPSVIYAVSKKVKGLQIYPVTFFNMSDVTVTE